MCLSSLVEKNSLVKKCRKSKLIPGALVAYKIIQCKWQWGNINSRSRKTKIWLASLYKSCQINAGWNIKRPKPATIHSKDDRLVENHPPFSYPSGIHAYASLAAARKNKETDDDFLVTIHFFPKDVLTEGMEMDYHDRYVLHPVIVLKKYLLEKKIKTNIIAKTKKHWKL